MKEQGRHIDIDELFREKLEAAELNPRSSLRADLMSRLARKEFLHFNPSRFNIYYAGAALATGVAAALLLLSSYREKSSSNFVSPGRNSETIAEIQQPSALYIAGQKVDNRDAGAGTSAEPVATGKVINIQDELKSGINPVENNQVPAITDSLIKTGAKSEIIPGIIDEPVLRKRLSASFEISGYSGCAPFKVRFINKSSNAVACQWTFGDGGSSTEREPEWIYDQDGEYRVTLRVTGEEGEEMSTTSEVNVFGRPVAQFEIYPEKPIIPDDAVRFLNYSKNAVKFNWDFGDGRFSDQYEPEHKYSKFGRWNVRLIALSEQGCADTVTRVDAFAGSGSYIEFPNAFIPNPDGPSGGYYSSKSDESAQIFHPVTSGVSEYQLRIFSKRGIMIFESNDINIGWDGYHKGQLCDPGVYVWKVRGTFRNGESFVRMGDLTLLKR